VTLLFKGCKRDLQRSGIRFGHDLNHLVVALFVEVQLFFLWKALKKMQFSSPNCANRGGTTQGKHTKLLLGMVLNKFKHGMLQQIQISRGRLH